LEGKPYTVSEYNHPAPLDSQAECVPLIASFAAAQDWDGVWLYTYSHSSDDWDRENLNSYFDIDTNPAKWGFMRAGAAIFCDSGIGLLNRSGIIGLTKPSEDMLTSLAKLHHKYDRDMISVLHLFYSHMLRMEVAVRLRGRRQFRDVRSSLPPVEPRWSMDGDKGFYVVRGNGASVFVGHAGSFEKATDRDIRITAPGFTAVTVTALDKVSLDQSQKILITACGRCENVGMKFSKDRRTVGRNWGHGPVQIEAVKGAVEIPKGDWRCQALGPDGLAKADVPVRSEGGRNYIDLLPQYGTMWYLLIQNSE